MEGLMEGNQSYSKTKIGWMLTLYIATKPFYIFPSGFLQPADLLLLVVFFYLVFTRSKLNVKHPLNTSSSKFILLYLTWLIYIGIVNLLWFVVLENTWNKGNNIDFLLSSIYSIFNFLVLCTCFFAYERIGPDIFKYVGNGFVLGTLVIAINLFFEIGGATRSTGGFNNPNQLGYYALLLMTGSAIFGSYMKKYQSLVVFLLSFIAILLSASKAALLGATALIFCLLIFKSKNTGIKSGIIKGILSLLLVSVTYLVFFDQTLYLKNDTLFTIHNRFEKFFNSGIAEQLGDTRGYDRIFDIGHYLIWGMGEGGFYRFSTDYKGESHSSFVTIFVSYGVIGCILWLLMFLVTKGNNTITSLYVFVGIFVYWMSHNGLRSTIFWLIVAAFLLYNNRSEKVQESNSSSNLIS